MMKNIFKITTLVWFVSVFSFIVIIAIATKLMTNDPSFSPGGGEAYLLMPMLLSAVLGIASFALVIFSLLVLKIRDKNINDKHESLARLKLNYFLYGGFFLIYSVFIFLLGWRQGNLVQTASGAFSGQELFDEINRFRTENGKAIVSLDVNLCDNLVSRYQMVSQGRGSHEGVEEWAKKEGLIEKYSLAEMYIVDSEIALQAVEFWNNSPGHRLVLLGDYQYGCSYAFHGDAVVIFGNKSQQSP